MWIMLFIRSQVVGIIIHKACSSIHDFMNFRLCGWVSAWVQPLHEKWDILLYAVQHPMRHFEDHKNVANRKEWRHLRQPHVRKIFGPCLYYTIEMPVWISSEIISKVWQSILQVSYYDKKGVYFLKKLNADSYSTGFYTLTSTKTKQRIEISSNYCHPSYPL